DLLPFPPRRSSDLLREGSSSGDADLGSALGDRSLPGDVRLKSGLSGFLREDYQYIALRTVRAVEEAEQLRQYLHLAPALPRAGIFALGSQPLDLESGLQQSLSQNPKRHRGDMSVIHIVT